MSAAVSRAAGKVGQAATKAAGKAAESGSSDKKAGVLQKGAKRDPELYVRGLSNLALSRTLSAHYT